MGVFLQSQRVVEPRRPQTLQETLRRFTASARTTGWNRRRHSGELGQRNERQHSASVFSLASERPDGGPDRSRFRTLPKPLYPVAFGEATSVLLADADAVSVAALREARNQLRLTKPIRFTTCRAFPTGNSQARFGFQRVVEPRRPQTLQETLRRFTASARTTGWNRRRHSGELGQRNERQHSASVFSLASERPDGGPDRSRFRTLPKPLYPVAFGEATSVLLADADAVSVAALREARNQLRLTKPIRFTTCRAFPTGNSQARFGFQRKAKARAAQRRVALSAGLGFLSVIKTFWINGTTIMKSLIKFCIAMFKGTFEFFYLFVLIRYNRLACFYLRRLVAYQRYKLSLLCAQQRQLGSLCLQRRGQTENVFYPSPHNCENPNAMLSRAGHGHERKRCAVSPRRPRTQC